MPLIGTFNVKTLLESMVGEASFLAIMMPPTIPMMIPRMANKSFFDIVFILFVRILYSIPMKVVWVQPFTFYQLQRYFSSAKCSHSVAMLRVSYSKCLALEKM